MKKYNAQSRILDILNCALDGNTITIKKLKEKYSEEQELSNKTLQRDFKCLADAGFELKETMPKSGQYKLSTNCCTKFQHMSLTNFADKTGIKPVFYPLEDKIEEFIKGDLDTAIMIKPFKKGIYNGSRNKIFDKIIKATQENKTVAFFYKDKTRKRILPYIIVEYDGNWYLKATEDGLVKTFNIEKIDNFAVNDSDFFSKSEQILKECIERDSIWHSDKTFTVTLNVAAEKAHYFSQRPQFDDQFFKEKNEDGSLTIKCTAEHPTAILPKIRSWAPYVTIVEPAHLRFELKQTLEQLLDKC